MEKLLKIGREAVPFESAYAVFDEQARDVTLFDNFGKADAIRDMKESRHGRRFYLYDGLRDVVR